MGGREYEATNESSERREGVRTIRFEFAGELNGKSDEVLEVRCEAKAGEYHGDGGGGDGEKEGKGGGAIEDGVDDSARAGDGIFGSEGNADRQMCQPLLVILPSELQAMVPDGTIADGPTMPE